MYTRQITELQDLIANPAEREWLELKSWIDLTDARFRAATARHLAAIANYGGGYLVFGFNDDGTRCAELNDVRKLYSQDAIALSRVRPRRFRIGNTPRFGWIPA